MSFIVVTIMCPLLPSYASSPPPSMRLRGRLARSCRLPVEHVPGSEHVGLRRARVADREPQDVTPVELRVRDEDLTRRVDARLQPLVLLVRTAPAKDDEREASRCDELPVVALFHPVGEELGETDVLT